MTNKKTPTFASIRRQIAYQPISREKAATSAQLDYLASLILECEGKPGWRWDYTTQETFTVRRASAMIETCLKIKG